MLMSVIDNSLTSSRYGELAGARVLITGLTPAAGVDIARAFADHKARLVVGMSETDEEATAVVAMLAETASELAQLDGYSGDTAGAQRLTQSASQVFGGLDAVVNIVTIDASEIAGLESLEEIEGLASRKLSPILEISRIAANRMRVLMTEGSILNIVILTGPISSGAALVGGYLRSALATMTRHSFGCC